jgi:Antitoxin VbhA
MTTAEHGNGAQVMGSRFAVEEWWPELFAQLDATQRRVVVQWLAAAWHAGWVPDREDVADLVEEALGAISLEEYRRRSIAKAERVRRVAEAIHSGQMEGLQVTVDGQADAQEYIAGRIDPDQLVARARARYGLPAEKEEGR